MKIASFNINNIKRRLTNLLNWLREAEPDIAAFRSSSAMTRNFRRREFGKPAIMRFGAERGAGTAWRF
jgi:exonuclease III